MQLNRKRQAASEHYARIKAQYATLPKGDSVQYVYGYSAREGDKFVVLIVFTANVSPGIMLNCINRDLMRQPDAEELSRYRLYAREEVASSLDIDPETGDLA
jgi:hypothetical protein